MNMSKYFVDCGTGAGNFYSDDDIETLKDVVASTTAYTQKSICIYDVIEDEIQMGCVAILPWYNTPATDEEREDGEVVSDYGDFGYYGEWID